MINLSQGRVKTKHSDSLHIQETLPNIEEPTWTQLDPSSWQGSFNAKESSLQQLSPYVGKLKSGMAQALIATYTRIGDTILDPFSGSGVVPLEAALSRRAAIANDLSPYAYVLTRGKLEAPANLYQALDRAEALVSAVERLAPDADVDGVPEWIRAFFHPRTLQEIVVAFQILRQPKQEDFFLTSCLLGILHHQRPGFLSFPASHLVPYLRISKYPKSQYPEMYEYRDLRSRLIKKVHRAYKRLQIPRDWESREFKVFNVNSMALPISNSTVDAIISSPPYFGALDYARDNRLRLWFLGCSDWRELDKSLTANQKVYLPQMRECLVEMDRVLKKGGHCILVLGDVERDGKTQRTAEILADLAAEATDNRFKTELVLTDPIPDERRTRRRSRTTKHERVLIMRKEDGG